MTTEYDYEYGLHDLTPADDPARWHRLLELTANHWDPDSGFGGSVHVRRHRPTDDIVISAACIGDWSVHYPHDGIWFHHVPDDGTWRWRGITNFGGDDEYVVEGVLPIASDADDHTIAGVLAHAMTVDPATLAPA